MDMSKELIGRAHELKPVIAQRAAATEENRALLDETVKDLCDAGFMQILTPKCYGGHELHIDTMVNVARILASACPSTGWVTSFYIGHNWLHAVFPQQAQDEVFADRPYQLSSGQLAPTAKAVRVPGGYEVSGRQAWSSGVVHAEWIFFTGMVAEDGAAPQPLMFCIPRSSVDVIDTWYIAGMKGTGSSDVAVEKVFVPEHRAVSVRALLDGTHPGGSIHSNPLYRLPAMTVLGLEAEPVLAGALRGAAENLLQITRERIATHTGSSVAAKPAAQMRIGRAFAAADAVDTLVDKAVARTISLDGSLPLSVEDRAHLRMHGALITKMCCDAVNDIAHGAGGNSFRDSAPLQRFFRDVNVLRTHAILDIEPASEIYGRVLLGMEPGAVI
jgi:3-hydroxy-9,10-secoandrosta-1,3,5(10)-triene-9,17-dione monooxygenase